MYDCNLYRKGISGYKFTVFVCANCYLMVKRYIVATVRHLVLVPGTLYVCCLNSQVMPKTCKHTVLVRMQQPVRLCRDWD